MTVSGLIERLRRAGVSPTARELAEAIWLAGRLDVAALAERPATPLPAAAEPGEASPSLASGGIPPPPGTAVVAVPSATGSGLVSGFPVRSPAAPVLPNARRLQRALRPLRRRVGDPRHPVLDEVATAQAVAGTGVWAPVLVAGRRRHFDAVLAVDTASSMDVWRDLPTGLAGLLTRSGAFRDVRVFRPGRGLRPAQLVDAGRRRVFLALTDGVSGGFAEQLYEWARTGPVVVVQPLPEQMWSRTALPVLRARVSAPVAGVPNTGLRVRFRRRQVPAGVPLPVVGLEPAALGAWARLAAGRSGEVSLAVALLGSEPPPPAAAGTLDDLSPVERFRSTASPQAYELAVCLSLVPVTLDTMRLMQHVTFAGETPSVLAEVILGGLLDRTGGDTYDFVPGARDELRAELRRSEAARVTSAMSRYVADHAGHAGAAFPAFVTRDDGPLETAAEPFAEVPESAAGRLGVPAPGPAVGAQPSWQGRIRDIAGRILGGGVLIADDRVLTCTHILSSGPERPDDSFVVDFPLAGRHVEIRGWVEAWLRQRDLAVLRLEIPVDGDITPAALRPAPDSHGVETRALGFPGIRPDGVWMRFVVGGPAPYYPGLLRLNSPGVVDPYQLMGFSGSGVIDSASQTVIGLFTMRSNADLPSAWMIPMETILNGIPPSVPRPASVANPFDVAGAELPRSDHFVDAGGSEHAFRDFAARCTPADVLRTGRFVAISGPPGSGRTSLGNRCADHFRSQCVAAGIELATVDLQGPGSMLESSEEIFARIRGALSSFHGGAATTLAEVSHRLKAVGTIALIRLPEITNLAYLRRFANEEHPGLLFIVDVMSREPLDHAEFGLEPDNGFFLHVSTLTAEDAIALVRSRVTDPRLPQISRETIHRLLAARPMTVRELQMLLYQAYREVAENRSRPSELTYEHLTDVYYRTALT